MTVPHLCHPHMRCILCCISPSLGMSVTGDTPAIPSMNVGFFFCLSRFLPPFTDSPSSSTVLSSYSENHIYLIFHAEKLKDWQFHQTRSQTGGPYHIRVEDKSRWFSCESYHYTSLAVVVEVERRQGRHRFSHTWCAGSPLCRFLVACG